MEVLSNGVDKPSKCDVRGNKRSRMPEWEMVSVEEKLEYGRDVIEDLIRKCNDDVIIRLLRCLLPSICLVPSLDRKNSLARFIGKVHQNLKRVESIERHLFLLILFLDPRGPKTSMPGMEEREMIRAVYEMPIIKFNNLLPNKCGSCRKWYAVPHLLLPEVACALCFRGRHDCKPIPKTEDKGIGEFIWFCNDCGYDSVNEFNGYVGKPKMTFLSFGGNRKGRERNENGKGCRPTVVDDSTEDEWDDDDDDDSIDDDDEGSSDIPQFILDNPDGYMNYESESSSDYDTDSYENFVEAYEEEEASKKVREKFVALQNLKDASLQKHLSGMRANHEEEVGGNTRRRKPASGRNPRRRGGTNSGNFQVDKSGQDLIDEQCRTAIGKRASGQVKGKNSLDYKAIEPDYSAIEPDLIAPDEVLEAIGKLRMDARIFSNGRSEPAIGMIMGKESAAYPLSTLFNRNLRERKAVENHLALNVFIFKEE